jgi:predicted phosphohydrolase
MVIRHDTLRQALAEIDSGSLTGASAIVVNRAWWEALSRGEQEDYRRACERHDLDLRADARLSKHFVEVIISPAEPPLSSERRV